jgi:hypothetical protein
VQVIVLWYKQCVASVFSCLLGQGMLKSWIRSSVYRLLSKASYLQSALTQKAPPLIVSTPYSVLTGAQYQTSYLPNIPPHNNKGRV